MVTLHWIKPNVLIWVIISVTKALTVRSVSNDFFGCQKLELNYTLCPMKIKYQIFPGTM